MNIAVLIDRLLSRRAPAPIAAERPLDELPVEPDEPVYGCGWFDSSHDLHRGLVVDEHADAQLPLGVWLDIHLGAWRAGQPA